MVLLSAQRTETAISEAAFTSEDRAREMIGNRRRSPGAPAPDQEDRSTLPG
jgi:hypothetical protein